MDQHMGIGERMLLKKRSRRTFHMQARGQARVSKYDKETGEFKGHTPWTKNTLTSEGIDKFLRALANDFSGHGALDATDASVGIATSSSPVSYVYTKVGTDIGPTGGSTTKSSPTASTLWEWWDNSVNTYGSANWLHFWYKDPEGSAGDEYRIAYVNIAAGNKPNDENWHYQFFLELYATDTDFTSAGLGVLLDLYNGNKTTFLTSTGIRLRPTTGAGSGTEIGSDLTPDANPTVNTTANTITWVWTVPDGTSNGAWVGTKIKIDTSFVTNLRWGGCLTNGNSCGTKGSGEEWEYTYTLTLSQGS